MNSGYSTSAPSSGSYGGAVSETGPGIDVLEKRKRQFEGYAGSKANEIDEQKQSRRYYHGSQWTAKQIETLKRRGQPIVTFNRIERKINSVVGLLERQKQDPKGYARTPQHEEGADIATDVLRYVTDQQEFAAKSPICGRQAAVDGLAGLEIVLEQGDKGDPEIGLEVVDEGTFFYDPRSIKQDFSDAMFMGISKLVDIDVLIARFPDKAEQIKAGASASVDLSTNPDNENQWFAGDDKVGRRARLVDHWYMEANEWKWCIYTGSLILDSGEGYLVDEKGKTFCKYIMFSANVDQDGDRYGFIRNMKSAQDEINHRRSKAMYLLNSRRVIVTRGQVPEDGIEKFRDEMSRPDGVGVINPGMAAPIFDDAQRGQEMNANLGFLADAKQEIENYGFNPALQGTGVQDMSGKAIQLQQAAGIAELGPFMLAFRGWKLRVYRAIWNAAKQWWTAERWIRVTDDEDLAKFVQVNGAPQIDPMTNMPAMDQAGAPMLTNALGSLDVDIIIDEGPDVITIQQANEDAATALAGSGLPIPPEVIIMLSSLDSKTKKQVLGALDKAKQEAMQAQQPGPVQQQAIMLDMQTKQLTNAKTVSETKLNDAKTVETYAKAESEEVDQMATAASTLKPDPQPTTRTLQ